MSTDTVKHITESEKQTDVVKEQMAQWTTDVSKILDAKTGDISWGKDEIPPQLMFGRCRIQMQLQQVDGG